MYSSANGPSALHATLDTKAIAPVVAVSPTEKPVTTVRAVRDIVDGVTDVTAFDFSSVPNPVKSSAPSFAAPTTTSSARNGFVTALDVSNVAVKEDVPSGFS